MQTTLFIACVCVCIGCAWRVQPAPGSQACFVPLYPSALVQRVPGSSHTTIPFHADTGHAVVLFLAAVAGVPLRLHALLHGRAHFVETQRAMEDTRLAFRKSWAARYAGVDFRLLPGAATDHIGGVGVRVGGDGGTGGTAEINVQIQDRDKGHGGSTRRGYGSSSPTASSDLVDLCIGGLADGHAAYDLMQRAASDPAARFWERWASQELHWFHDALGAWLSQSTDGGWTGWNVDGSPTTLDSWQPWETAVDASEAPHVRWFCGARTNAAFNEIDRHVLRGHGSEVAFIAESPSGETTRITRRWLLLHSVLIAHALQNGLRITAPQRIALCRRRVERRPLQK